MTAITLNLNPIIPLSDEQFYQLCQANPDIKIERNAEGKIIAMPPNWWEDWKSEHQADTAISQLD